MRIVSRAEWGARHPDGSGSAPLPAEFLYIHHTDSPSHTTIRTLEDIGQQRFGAGISYTFVIRDDGTVYQGHSVGRKGTHTKGLNTRARAICAIGNYDIVDPPERLLAAIVDLVVHGYRKGWWPNQITGGHRNAPGASTACPGDRLYARIPDMNRLITARLAAPPEDDMTPEQATQLAEVLRLARQTNHPAAHPEGNLAKVVRMVRDLQKEVAEIRAELAKRD
jgi:hypothetical protein